MITERALTAPGHDRGSELRKPAVLRVLFENVRLSDAYSPLFLLNLSKDQSLARPSLRGLLPCHDSLTVETNVS